MATIEGAAALGLDHMLGSLETGKEADIIAVHLPVHLPNAVEAAGLPAALVARATAGDVRLTMVAGKIVFDREGASEGQDDLDSAYATVRTKLVAQ
jgi:5-methylthioadenosine/S-adenosylhomocysteine deaminase